jgi:hypothetical protein
MPTNATRWAGAVTTAQTRKAATSAGAGSGTSWTRKTTGLATRQVIHPKCHDFQNRFILIFFHFFAEVAGKQLLTGYDFQNRFSIFEAIISPCV